MQLAPLVEFCRFFIFKIQKFNKKGQYLILNVDLIVFLNNSLLNNFIKQWK